MQEIKLTQTVQKGGCAAKVAAAELRNILAKVKFPSKPKNLLVDGSHFDDAAIYKVTDDLALVQTLDFFTPILDTPETFGMVAACNALSDVYAMGGRPITAMAILAFPLSTIESSVVTRVLQGASDVLEKANCPLVGGHSIDDDTLKFGLSVTGTVDPRHVWSNQGAQAGDKLILTKPLGTGTLTAALKRGELSEADISDAIDSMSALNNAIDYLSDEQLRAVHAATDITGFGLAGHSYQLAKASQVTIKFNYSTLPKFKRAEELISAGFLTKAHRTNKEYTSDFSDFGSLNETQMKLVFDPQTSGGLLLSVDSKFADQVCKALKSAFASTSIVGEVVEKQNLYLYF